MYNARLKQKIYEGITNLSNMGQIPTEEVQLNLDVLYNSILEEVCSIIPIESPRAIISCLQLVYDSENKSKVELSGDIEKDAFKLVLMNGVGAVPFDDNGYPTNEVHCIIIPDENNSFLANYNNVIPGTVNIADEFIDDGEGKLINKTSKAEVGTVDYITGLFKFTGAIPASATLSYKYDIYNLEYQRNFTKFVKKYIEVFADLFALDIDSALILNDIKSLDLKANIKNILPQVLSQQIDQFILDKYFKQAKLNMLNEFDSNDLGTFISNNTNIFIDKQGVMPNVILCNAKAYGLLSASLKFQPTINSDKESQTAGTPKLVGYFNNYKVILTNSKVKDVDLVLTYKGESDAQAAGIYTPFIPVTLRTVEGGEGGGMITTTNAYSMGGFTMINPDLVVGVKIKE